MGLELDGENFPTDSFSELDGITFSKQFHVLKTVKNPRNQGLDGIGVIFKQAILDELHDVSNINYCIRF